MAGFFIPGIGQGGGVNPNPNPDAFTRVNFNDQTNELILTTAGGVAIPVDLSNIKPTITQGAIKSFNIVNKELVIEDVDGQIVQIPLSRVLGGADIALTPIQGVQLDNVQGAIEEVNNKVNDAYTNSSYNAQTGQLTLTKANGQDDILNLGVSFNGVREFSYNPVTQVIDVVDHTNTPVRVDLSIFAEDTDLNAIREKLINNATLDGNSIVITLNDNTTHRVDLTNILGGDITDVVYNDVAYTLTVTKKGQPQPTVYNLSNLIGVTNVEYEQATQKFFVTDNQGRREIADLTTYATDTELKAVDDKIIVRGEVVGNNIELEQKDGNKITVDVSALAVGDVVSKVVFEDATNELKVTTNGQEQTYDLSKFDGVKVFNYDTNTKMINVTNQNNQQYNIDLKQFATEVNGKQVVDGSVTVVAGDINYDGQISGIQATDVQGAIDELKRDMALLDNSDIFIVSDLQDYNNRKDTFNLKSGDLIYFLDSNAVVDFNDQAVNNGGKPVVMIFDENAQGASGNNLRIFSKPDTTINITAKDVSFDKNGTSLTKDNVQEAIVETNSKIITTGTLNGNIIELTQENGGKIDVDVTRLVGISTINSESPDMQGNIMLSVDITSNDTIDFKVNSANFGRLTYITDNQVNEIINLFV